VNRRVRWFDEAIDDLIDHVAYVAEESPAAVRRIGLRIREAGDGLGDFAIGRPGLVPDTFERVLADVPYTIVYSINDLRDGEVISILRVVYQALQWPPES
jgi:toxin ParE1/3/4